MAHVSRMAWRNIWLAGVAFSEMAYLAGWLSNLAGVYSYLGVVLFSVNGCLAYRSSSAG
jgi:hypothetical protein